MHPVVLCLQDQLGEVVYVQLPEIDTELELGRKFLKKKIQLRQTHVYDYMPFFPSVTDKFCRFCNS